MNNENIYGGTNGKEFKEEKPETSDQNDDAEVQNMDDYTITCPTSVLAAQIRKVLPAANVTNRQSSILLDNLLDKKETTDSTSKKRVTFASSRNVNFTSEIEMEELIQPEEGAEAVNASKAESIIRDLPVSIGEKRQRRSSVLLLTKKPWSTKVKDYLNGVTENLQSFKLWHEDLKLIEGKFGASVVSYFVFIRWLLFMDLIILFLNLVFLVIPQYTFLPIKAHIDVNMTLNQAINANFSVTKVLRKEALDIKLGDNPDDDTKTVSLTGSEEGWPQFEAWDDAALNNSNASVNLIQYCRYRYMTQVENVTTSGFFVHLQNILQGTGGLEQTLLFIGSYPIEDVFFFGEAYYMPLAVIWVLIVSFLISLIMMVQYASFGIQEAFITREDFHSFANDLFCGWDYCITNSEAAALHHEKFVVELKSNLSEARLKKEISTRTTAEWLRIYCQRFFVNVIVILFLVGCYVVIYKVALFEMQEFKTNNLETAGLRSFFVQYLPSITCVAINFIAPYLFDFLGAFEKYHGQKEVNKSLIRNNFTSLSSIIVLISAFHQQIICKPRDICGAGMSYDCRTPRCWETYVGQQLYKLSMIQTFLVIGVFLFVDVPRDYIAKKYDNKYTRLMGRPPFCLPIEVLGPIYAQAVLWLGVFYSPMLPLVTVIMLLFLYYTKKAKVLTYSEPSLSLYKASRFNSAFMNILVISYFVILTVHLYTLVKFRPSLGCSPFRVYNSMMDAMRRAFQFLPFDLITVFNFIFSGWFFTLASILMCAIIYHYSKYNAHLESLELSLKADLLILSQDKQYLLKKMVEEAKKTD